MHNLAVRRIWLFLCVAGFLALGARAQTHDLARFPSVERVLAEPGDDAEHYATLKVLSEAAQMAGPAGQTLFGVYYNALNDIDFRMRNGDAAAYVAFSERLRERLAADEFRSGVRARFGLDGAAPAAAEESDELDRALRASVPYWIAVLCVLLIASPLFVFALDRRRLPASARGRDSLPDALRTVHVLGRSYDVDAHSGTVVEKESSIEQRLHVHTTGGGATVIGDHVSVAPTQVHAHTEITRKDCLWVRDAAGAEHAWNFTNAALQARAGHALSAVSRPAADGGAEFLLAYNHATGQLDTFGGLARAHQPRRLAAWVATTVVAAAAILFAMRVVVDASGDTVSLGAMYQLGNWPAPLGIAGVAAAICVPLCAAALRGLRTRAFLARTAPAFRRHFETRTRV
ncbi:MAG: hypothetical protein EPO68_02185 [Planctomycetota bacterium]|nr:MAG: hypothetical protein EPO68_02185 [Planctomycetota bacterium]